MSDTLLKSFSHAQKLYIIRHIYPELSKALIHFISEAKRHNEIDEPNSFGESPPRPSHSLFQPQPPSDTGAVNNNRGGNAAPLSSAFCGYKMGQSQPSNMQTTTTTVENNYMAVGGTTATNSIEITASSVNVNATAVN